jgi:hypothetical protein
VAVADLAWVVLGLTIAYGAMAGYVVSLELRRRRLERTEGR